MIEVGCAPAKWLAFYAERFGAQVSGIEYTAKGAALSRANLEALGIDGEIHEADFFGLEPSPHDLVASFGFIEHFDDVDTAFARHVEFTAPGGRIALGVPNFRRVNRVLQRIADPAFLALHNPEAMDPGRFRAWARQHDLTLEHLGYLGGFDPALITPRGRRGVGPALATAAIYAGLAYRRLPVSDRLNSPAASSYLLGVFRRQQ